MKISSRYIAIAIGIILVGGLIYFFSPIVTYVVIAWILSMIGQPFMDFFQQKVRIGKWRLGPNVSAILTLLCFIIVISLLVMLFAPLILEQANNLAQVDYSEIVLALEEPINQFDELLEKYGLERQDPQDRERRESPFQFEKWFNPSEIGTLFSTVLSTAGYLLISIFSVIFVTFFFLKEQGLFTNFVTALVPSKYETQVANAIEDISHLLTRYFGGILIQMSIITVIVWVGLSLFGVENALLIGFFAALINVIPYLGPVIGAIFGAILTISTNLDLDFYSEMFPLLLKVAAVFATMQLIDNFILQPFIFSTSVLAHPLEIFIVILMGAQINGIVGMVLAIPVYTVIRVIAGAFLSEFKLVQRMTDRMKDIEHHDS